MEIVTNNSIQINRIRIIKNNKVRMEKIKEERGSWNNRKKGQDDERRTRSKRVNLEE